jgi:hypothetical protein
MEMRRMMISMVLGTDMTRHFNHFKEFKSALDLCGKDATCWESHIDVLMSQILHVADIRCLTAAWNGNDPCCLVHGMAMILVVWC